METTIRHIPISDDDRAVITLHAFVEDQVRLETLAKGRVGVGLTSLLLHLHRSC